MKKINWLVLIAVTSFWACSKESNSISNTSNLYVPTASDTTVNATLLELQEGRDLFINNCGACHSLYSPDSYSVSQWKSILNQMTPRTSMTSSQVTLVTKYVCRGRQ